MRRLLARLMAAVAVAMFAALLTGCADREANLIGKWKASVMSSTFKAIKMKEDTGATQQQAQDAARIMAATFVDINSDKTFTAGAGGATSEGNWTFNKETGEVVLNITTMKGLDGAVAEQKPTAWTAYMDESDMRLAFYPMPPESVALIKESKVKGGLSGGISLYRN